MPSRPACLVLGLGIGALIPFAAGVVTQAVLNRPVFYPPS